MPERLSPRTLGTNVFRPTFRVTQDGRRLQHVALHQELLSVSSSIPEPPKIVEPSEPVMGSGSVSTVATTSGASEAGDDASDDQGIVNSP